MKRFIDRVADKLLDLKTPLYRQHVVLPNRRAALFLKEALKNRATKPLIAPEISSIETFMNGLSGLSTPSHAELLLEFYAVVRQREQAMRFEPFLHWAPQTLRDFNDLDLYLVDTDRFFEYLEAERKLEHWTLAGEQPSAMVQNYLSFWKNMGLWYGALRARLCSKGLAYQGLSFRLAAENIKSQHPEGSLVFAGFSALTPAESSVIFHLLEAGVATTLWDVDAHSLQAGQEAGAFLRDYQRRITQRGLPFEWVSDHLSQAKKVVVHACPKALAQTHTAGEILARWCVQSTDLTHCAVVLADEGLLPALLDKIPEGVGDINPTMGFPLAHTQWSKLFAALLDALCTAHEETGGKAGNIKLRQLVEILRYPPVINLLEREENRSKVQRFLALAKAENRPFVALEKLSALLADSALKAFFNPRDQRPQSLLRRYLALIESSGRDDPSPSALERAAAAQLRTLLERALAHLERHDFLNKPTSFERFLALLMLNQAVDCHGQALSGLQIMGILETRCLDFEKVILLSANEGLLPANQRYDSYIPFAIRRHFKMPTYRDREAVYAYHFHHLLQRCEEAQLIYSSETTSLGGGEKSRFIRQYQNEIATANRDVQRTPTLIHKNEKRVIQKSESILLRLHQKAESGISPSFLGAYLRNPIDFYYEHILGLRQPEASAETIQANTLGSIVHDTLETLYGRYSGQQLDAALFDSLLQEAEAVYTHRFQAAFSRTAYRSGYNKLVYEVFKKLLFEQLKRDRAQAARLRFRFFERELSSSLRINDALTVRLKGKIDRVDQLDGVCRIIDYKTGRADRTLSLSTASDLETFLKRAQADRLLQLMLYTHLFFEQPEVLEQRVESGIIYLASASPDNYLPLTIDKDRYLTPAHFERFQPLLSALLEELFDPDIPFIEKEGEHY